MRPNSQRTFARALSLCALSVCLFLSFARIARADLVTSNGLVTAIVSDSTGLIYFLNISSGNQSYLSVQIDDEIYSNNTYAQSGIDHLLNDAITAKLQDTIVALWSTKDSVDIIQRIYPVNYGTRGEFVISIAFVNHSRQPYDCSAQYLLSTHVGLTTIPKFGSREQYSANSQQMLSIDSGGLPDMFFLTERDVSIAGTATGACAMGRWIEPQLGLIPPFRATYSTWTKLAAVPYGDPGAHLETDCNGGLLMEWNGGTTAPGASLEAARFTYGNATPTECTSDDATVLTFYNASTPTLPYGKFDTVRVNSFVFATSQGGLRNVRAGLSTASPYAIVRRNGAQTVHDTLLIAGQLLQHQIAEAAWNVVALQKPSDVRTVDGSFLTSVTSSLNPPFFRDGCGFTLTETVKKPAPIDLAAPVVTAIRSVGSFDRSQCNARIYDVTVADSASGIHSVTALTSGNFVLDVPVFIDGSPVVTYGLHVIDSLIAGSATIRTSDRAGNHYDQQFTYCPLADTKAPEIMIEHLSAQAATIAIADSAAWDRRLDSIAIRDSLNIRADGSNSNVRGEKSVELTVSRVDPDRPASFSIAALDRAGNWSSFLPVTLEGRSVRTHPARSRVSCFPNPSTDILTVQSAPPLAACELLDLLGRTVATVRADDYGSAKLSVHALPAGSYYLRIESLERVETLPIEVRH